MSFDLDLSKQHNKNHFHPFFSTIQSLLILQFLYWSRANFWLLYHDEQNFANPGMKAPTIAKILSFKL